MYLGIVKEKVIHMLVRSVGRKRVWEVYDIAAMLKIAPLLFLLSVACPCHSQSAPVDIATLVKQAGPAVVFITVINDLGQSSATGSGFILSEDGKVVTNNHVVSAGTHYVVELNNGSSFRTSSVLAASPELDVAILKVDGHLLPTLHLRTELPEVGEAVVAMGSPLGLQNSVSSGIVGGIRADGDKTWIQLSVPASPGSSGGPVLDRTGEVLGIVTWKFAQGESLTFAVPSAAIADVQKSGANTSPTVAKRVSEFPVLWTSLTDGSDYEIRLDGTYLYSNAILPQKQVDDGYFIRSELKGSGQTWAGKERVCLPCIPPFGTFKLCTIETDIEISSVSDRRIEGRQQSFHLNCRKCAAENLKWKPFVWISK